MSDSHAVFLDTSIQIARWIHSPETRQHIEDRLRTFSFTVTGAIVKQEVKRRLLKDAKYLLDLFERHYSYAKVQRHVIDVLSPFQKRKQKISLQLLATLFEHESDEDLTDRAVLLLTGLLRDGLYEFEQSVGHVLEKSDCGCAKQGVTKRGKRYDFGNDRCSQVANCGIGEFLESRRSALEEISKRLEDIDPARRTSELTNAAEFIGAFLDDPKSIRQRDPCKTVGDLLIAVESLGIPVFYTMNGKESQHLCRALKQSLIVRPTNPNKDDISCAHEDQSWPDF